ncbi:MAG TPA: DUF58 domain-containing protein [Terriglobales bacterium]|nr:DUF58 domain-containing protein [Terriglobales bacterium]
MKRILKSVLAGLDREAWIRFFLALIGLAMAFGAALLSTITRQEGNLWATAILASAALLLAAWVGATTVPYLARRVSVLHVRDALDFDVTREGLLYVGMVVVIGVAALNTGNNLLFIILSSMLAAIFVSGIASTALLRSIEMDVGLPEFVFANTEAYARLILRNTRRILPVFSVSVVPVKEKKAVREWKWKKTRFRFPLKAAPGKQWIELPDFAMQRVNVSPESEPILRDSVYFPFLPPRQKMTADVKLSFIRRGRLTQNTFGLGTRFPFSFLTKTRRIRLTKELIVYPSIEPTDEFFEILPIITGEYESFVAGRGYDLYRIREYTSEDPARHLDWKATAKTGSLKIREFTREDERKLRFVFDNPAPGGVTDDAYERAVTLVASLAWHFAREGAQLTFLAPGLPLTSDLHEFLRYLAVVQSRVGDSVLDQVRPSDDYNLVFTPRARGTIPTVLWSCSYIVFLN